MKINDWLMDRFSRAENKMHMIQLIDFMLRFCVKDTFALGQDPKAIKDKRLLESLRSKLLIELSNEKDALVDAIEETWEKKDEASG